MKVYELMNILSEYSGEQDVKSVIAERCPELLQEEPKKEGQDE